MRLFLCPCSLFLWNRIFSFFSYKNNSQQLRYCCCCDQPLSLYTFVTIILTPHDVYAVYLSHWIQYRWTDRQTHFEKDVGLKENEVQFHMCTKQQIRLKIWIIGLVGEGGEYALHKTTPEELDSPPPRVATRSTVTCRVTHSLLPHSLEVELKSR